MKKPKNLLVKILATVLYLAMVTTNALANFLPINNISTGGVSDYYENLFAPTGLTFSIWGLIYLLLGAYVIYQFFASKESEGIIEKISPYFILTSILNISWIFAWHYDYIGLSTLIIIFMLLSLIKIASIFRKEKFNNKQSFFIYLPFSIYFGWITVATIANITTYLVSINWDGWGVSEEIWTAVILIAGAIIGISRMLWAKNIPYGLVLIWAYLGILIKHTSYWAGVYNLVIFATILSILAFIATEMFLLIKMKKLK